jgi:hypothetical protein
MHADRRSFLKMVGVAAVAPALPALTPAVSAEVALFVEECESFASYTGDGDWLRYVLPPNALQPSMILLKHLDAPSDWHVIGLPSN